MKIKYIFLDQDLRMAQLGLLKKMKQKRASLKGTQFALFLNRQQTMFKLLSSDNVVLISYKNAYGRINPLMIRDLHKYWDGTKINIDKAQRESLQKSLEKKLKRKSK